MKTHKLFTIVGLFVFMTTNLLAYESRDLLKHKFSTEKVREALIMNQKWVPYPNYKDREGWNKFMGEYKDAAIKQGEKFLTYEWKVVPATAYIEYEKSGNRRIMEDPLGANNKAVSALMLAELAEGKGRFIPQLINGSFNSCEMTSWVLSAHLSSGQLSRRALPDYNDEVIDLVSGEMGAQLSWVHYFFNKEFDKVTPQISERIRHEVKKRILYPYIKDPRFWWIALPYKPGMMINNWNPWCNFNVLQCFLLMENNREKLAKAVCQTMESVDQFINYTHADGACEEGPSYWGHAAGKFYDYLQILSDGTGGKINIFDQSIVKNMGEYIARSYVGDGWVVNFADASARGGGSGTLIFRYGKAVGSDLMKGYAAFLNQKENSEKRIANDINTGTDIFRTLQTILYKDEMNKATAEIPFSPYSWYPQTEFCYMKNKNGMFLATKGGYNNESHNHNDAGSFSLYLNNMPIFIDAGVGTYTRQTFSSERYDIWTMQSNYHNLPMINGVPEKFGSEYKATDVKFDPKRKTFSANIATAYPKEAEAKSWIRSYTLQDKGLKIEDTFTLNEAVNPNIINFLTWGKIDISKAGEIIVEVENQKMKLDYDPRQFSPSIETVTLDDPRLSGVWGKEIYRISLTAKSKKLSDKYTYQITQLK